MTVYNNKYAHIIFNWNHLITVIHNVVTNEVKGKICIINEVKGHN